MLADARMRHVTMLARHLHLRIAKSPRTALGEPERRAILEADGNLDFGGGGPKPYGYSATLDSIQLYLETQRPGAAASPHSAGQEA